MRVAFFFLLPFTLEAREGRDDSFVFGSRMRGHNYTGATVFLLNFGVFGSRAAEAEAPKRLHAPANPLLFFPGTRFHPENVGGGGPFFAPR